MTTDVQKIKAGREYAAARPHEVMNELGQLALFLGGSGDSFTGQLLALMMKADPGNRERLATAFPIEHNALRAWQNLPTPTPARLAFALGLIDRVPS